MRRFLVSLVLFATACSQLPSEWASANVVENFTQSACAPLPELEARGGERLAVQPAGTGRLRVEYRNAHFRCEQKVTAYAKVNGSAVDVLVQPADMNPSSVAKCNCLYDIAFEVPGLAAGTYDVLLQRRWDDRNSPNDPVRIGATRVTVP